MTQIESIDFPCFLTEPIKSALKKHHIITVIDFINQDAKKLAELTKRTVKDIVDMKSYIHTHFGGKRETGYEIYQNIQRTTIAFKTGIERYSSHENNTQSCHFDNVVYPVLVSTAFLPRDCSAEICTKSVAFPPPVKRNCAKQYP